MVSSCASDSIVDAIPPAKVEREEFHGEWNYVISFPAWNSVDRSNSPFPVPYAGSAKQSVASLETFAGHPPMRTSTTAPPRLPDLLRLAVDSL